MHDLHSSGPGRSARGARATVIPLSMSERRIIFRQMVKAELEAGLLRYNKRRQLLRYATKMGLPRMEAHVIMAQVQHGLEWSDERPQSRSERAGHNQMIMRLLLACSAAVAVHWLTLRWLLG